MSDKSIKNVERIGIIAGNGNLPKILVETCLKQNREIFVVYIGGDKTPEYLKEVEHKNLSISAVGKALKLFKKNSIKKLVLAGAIKRPPFRKIWPDSAGLKLLAQISTNKTKGDNSVLSTVISFLEDSGFEVVGADEISANIIASAGIMGNINPSTKDNVDIELGQKVARAIGSFDIGQSVVVKDGVIIGVEAIEGTDGLLERCANHSENDELGGVLVKTKKPNQDTRVDLPTIGVDTVVNAHKAELSGIAIESGAALIVDKEEMIKKADTLGLFVIGI